jgi:hypothetical protein
MVEANAIHNYQLNKRKTRPVPNYWKPTIGKFAQLSRFHNSDKLDTLAPMGLRQNANHTVEVAPTKWIFPLDTRRIVPP